MKHKLLRVLRRARAISAPRSRQMHVFAAFSSIQPFATTRRAMAHDAAHDTPNEARWRRIVEARWRRIVEKLATVRWLQVVFNVSGTVLQQYPQALRDRVSSIGRGVPALRRP